MRKNILKKTAFFVLTAFLLMTIDPYFSHAQFELNEFEIAKEFYNQGNYDKAIDKFDAFIDVVEKRKSVEKYKNQLIQAYYYKAKIYFTFDEVPKMEASLASLFSLNPQYNFPLEDDAVFLKKAQAFRPVPHGIMIAKNGKKRKYTWLLVAVGIVAVGIGVYLLTKKPKRTLNVTVGEGVDGSPVSGTSTYKNKASVNYNYILKSGYSGMSVKLDGAEVASSGTIKMDKDHALTASAAKTYTLTVIKGMGVNGTPENGTFIYAAGSAVNYNYSLQSGYSNLSVKMDGTEIPSSGTITMNDNHTLTVTAGKTYTLTVTKSEGVIGLPDSGIHSYVEDTSADYSYSLQSGYKDLVVKLDGIPVSAIGSIPMTTNHSIDISAVKVGYYTLTVTKGAGVSGSPDTGATSYKEGTSVNYNYSLQAGYKDLVITLDGKTVEPTGSITMNKNRTLIASATQIGYYTLTVTKGVGVNGTPETGVSTHKENTPIGYSYTLQSGYGNLVVKLDGNTVSASGTINMKANHTLTATASKKYTLAVTMGSGVNGTPNTGTFEYTDGDSLSYNYSLQTGYKYLDVTLDGNVVSVSGTITMNRNHTLIATASKEYTLAVTKGTGVTGIPNTGSYTYKEGSHVSYSYSLQSGYQNLDVTLDGNLIALTGTITMNGNHTLVASATRQWTLTVTRGTGVAGTPVTGTYIFANGSLMDYNYTLQSVYTNLVVTLDGNAVAAMGNITMTANHTVIASAVAADKKKDK